jgi:hypothetical protein
LIEKANRQKWEKEQRKWIRDWIKAYGRKPGEYEEDVEA